MYKLDLHTHSIVSPDGGLEEEHYKRAFERRLVDYVAITDHNRIDYAKKLHKKLGARIIVGEEIMTTKGEIIGLFLTEAVPAKLSPKRTVELIKNQGGLVYIPHPFETVRSGMQEEALAEIADNVDVIEAYNGRAFFQNRTRGAYAWAKKHNMAIAASSDAHGWKGLGFTYTTIQDVPSRKNFLKLLKGGELTKKKPTTRAILYPKYNRMKKRLINHKANGKK